MPFSAADMKAKGAKQPEQAARIANGVLASCLAGAQTAKQRAKCDGLAIATALARTNKGK